MNQKDVYTAEDRKVWELLFDRQMALLSGKACDEFLQGIERVGFQRSKVPTHGEINLKLQDLTGWRLYAVPGIVPNQEFFEALSRRCFPATSWLRSMEQLHYLEEPDMFHDVFGHVPLLSNPAFCQFLEGLSRIALKHLNDAVSIEKIARMYWYSVEFGLIVENEEALRIYGAGILSSTGETEYSMGGKPARKNFDPETILETPYFTDRFQDQYFVITSFDELYTSLAAIDRVLSGHKTYATVPAV